MISKTTKVVNNKFQVTFNFTPDDVVHSRKNSKGTYKATHKGNGTTKRKGIWEGIEIVEVKTKIGSGAWRSHKTSKTVTVETTSNDVVIQAQAKYRLKCMGWHWNDFTGTYPFFWFGNISNVAYKYREGSFRDKYPKSPGSEHHICAVPSTWKYINCQWSDWAYKHAQDTPNWDFSNGRYEQRNGDYEVPKSSNGWISDSNLKQMYRKSMLYNFERTYTIDVKSSGISTNPNAPTLTVHSAKGDKGDITVKYVDVANKSGNIKVKAYCKDKTIEVISYNNSGTFANNTSKKFTIDFNKHFGEAYRGNDIYYEAWAKNSVGFECKNSTGKKGLHRYNGRPSIPTNLMATGSKEDAVVYNYVDFSWNKSTDPDNDSLTYDLWLKATDPTGKIIKDSLAKNNINTLYINKYDIGNFPDGSTMEIKIRAYDGLLYSDWSSIISFEKGAVPIGSLALIAPLKSGNLYNTKPRFTFGGYDGESEFVFVYNNIEYTTNRHSNLFTKSKDRVMFKPDFNIPNNSQFECHGYMKNQYGNSKKTPVYKFVIKNPYENITEGEIITASNVKQVQLLIVDFCKAYNREFNYEEAIKYNLVKAKTFNECRECLNNINTYINNLIITNTFDYLFKVKEVIPGDINDDTLWDNLINEMNNI